jgi:adenosylhomocysteine nucleosidase
MLDKLIPVLVAVDGELSVKLPYPYVKVVIGVGKVNAAIGTLNAIEKYKPTRIINFGTAGTLNSEEYGPGLYKIGSVKQRDMDCRPLGTDLGDTPFDPIGTINFGEGPCLSTGDNFVTSKPELSSDLVDMEAYAIAKACMSRGVHLDIYKYVTDTADDNAAGDWLTQMEYGAQEFVNLIDQ